MEFQTFAANHCSSWNGQRFLPHNAWNYKRFRKSPKIYMEPLELGLIYHILQFGNFLHILLRKANVLLPEDQNLCSNYYRNRGYCEIPFFSWLSEHIRNYTPPACLLSTLFGNFLQKKAFLANKYFLKKNMAPKMGFGKQVIKKLKPKNKTPKKP